MCSYGDGAELWKQTTKTARKTYHCAECPRAIESGAVYLHVFIVFDGTATVSRSHLACGFLASVLGEMLCGGEYGLGQMEEHLREAGVEPGDGALADEHFTLDGDTRARVRDFYLSEVV